MLPLTDLLDLYLRHRPDLRSLRARRATFERHVLPALGAIPVAELRRSQIALMLDRVALHAGPVMADRTLAYLRAALHWYEARTDDWRSPIVRGMHRRAGGERTRVLSDEELRRIWGATEGGAPFSRLVRVLLLTGQRRGEVAGMQWHEVDVAARLWTIPPERFKSGQAQLVPLPQVVIELLGSRGAGGPYVCSTTNGRRPISGFGKAVARLQRRSRTNGWRLHDLRRTVRTRLAGLRVSHAVAELVLGHGKRGLARVYDQHQYLDEVREALERWAVELERIVAVR